MDIQFSNSRKDILNVQREGEHYYLYCATACKEDFVRVGVVLAKAVAKHGISEREFLGLVWEEVKAMQN